MIALQITFTLLYFSKLSLTFMALRRHLFENTWNFTEYGQSQVRYCITPASKSAWVFFIQNPSTLTAIGG